MQYMRLHWDAVLGWIVDTEISLDSMQLKRVCDWALPRQISRYNSLPLGSKKDELAAAIKKLRAYQISQRLVYNQAGEAALFKSNQGTGKIISVGGM